MFTCYSCIFLRVVICNLFIFNFGVLFWSLSVFTGFCFSVGQFSESLVHLFDLLYKTIIFTFDHVSEIFCQTVKDFNFVCDWYIGSFKRGSINGFSLPLYRCVSAQVFTNIVTKNIEFLSLLDLWTHHYLLICFTSCIFVT